MPPGCASLIHQPFSVVGLAGGSRGRKDSLPAMGETAPQLGRGREDGQAEGRRDSRLEGRGRDRALGRRATLLSHGLMCTCTRAHNLLVPETWRKLHLGSRRTSAAVQYLAVDKPAHVHDVFLVFPPTRDWFVLLALGSGGMQREQRERGAGYFPRVLARAGARGQAPEATGPGCAGLIHQSFQ